MKTFQMLVAGYGIAQTQGLAMSSIGCETIRFSGTSPPAARHHQETLMRSGLMPVFTAIAMFGAPLQAALAQVHVAESDAYTMRASVVPSNQLSSEAAREHGISVSGDRGVINVVVLERKQDAERSVPAKVSATRSELSGRVESIEMREMRANGGVSYLGSFDVVVSPTARYRIEALPAGAAQPLSVEFEERFHIGR